MRGFLIFVVWILFTLVAEHSARAAPPSTVQLLYGPLTRPHTRNVLQKELEKTGTTKLAVTDILEELEQTKQNPFLITFDSFWTGDYLVRPGEPRGDIPAITPTDEQWFEQVVREGKLPDIFLIGGHSLVSLGWHDHAEEHFLYLPTLLETVKRSTAARRVFDNVKIALLWGCYTLANLEPHAASGDHLSAEEIRGIYLGSPEGRKAMIGPPEDENQLEGYKTRLATRYGPDSPIGEYVYTRDPNEEECSGPARYQDCVPQDLERLLPEEGLFDGTHRYNNAFLMKQLFPNAMLVLGYTTPSPDEGTRSWIFSDALKRSYALLNKGLTPDAPGYASNILLELLDEATPEPRRRHLIEVLRRSWTMATFAINRGRPSGSITPRYPELDKNGLFNVLLPKAAPQYRPPAYRPYERRSARP